MSDGFVVDPGRIRAHATGVTQVGHTIEAKIPGEQNLSTDAYGIVGQIFSGAAISATATGMDAVQKLCRALSGTAEGLRSSASDYENADRRSAALFGGDG